MVCIPFLVGHSNSNQSALCVGIVVGSSTYPSCTPASPLPCRRDILFDLEPEEGVEISAPSLTSRDNCNQYRGSGYARMASPSFSGQPSDDTELFINTLSV
jgi:hypothetical protein